MKKYFIAIIILIFSLLNISLYAEVVERIVAKVNDGIITLSEFEKYAKDAPFSQRDDLLDNLIEFELVEQIGRKYSIHVLESEVESSIDTIIELNNLGSQENLENILIQQGMAQSLYAYKKIIRKDLIIQRLALYLLETNSSEIKVTKPTSEEIKEYYEQNKDLYKVSGERKISHIVISAGSTADDYRNADNLANEIVNQIKSGESSFAENAIKYSIDEDSKNIGGNLGYFTKDQLQAKYYYYTDTVFSGEKGDLEIITTTNDVVILLISDIREERERTFSEVYNIIRNELFFKNFQEEFPDYIYTYKENSKIEKLL